MDEVSGYRVDCRWSARARSAKADAPTRRHHHQERGPFASIANGSGRVREIDGTTTRSCDPKRTEDPPAILPLRVVLSEPQPAVAGDDAPS